MEKEREQESGRERERDEKCKRNGLLARESKQDSQKALLSTAYNRISGCISWTRNHSMHSQKRVSTDSKTEKNCIVIYTHNTRAVAKQRTPSIKIFRNRAVNGILLHMHLSSTRLAQASIIQLSRFHTKARGNSVANSHYSVHFHSLQYEE